jgi:hypothetical protein
MNQRYSHSFSFSQNAKLFQFLNNPESIILLRDRLCSAAVAKPSEPIIFAIPAAAFSNHNDLPL